MVSPAGLNVPHKQHTCPGGRVIGSYHGTRQQRRTSGGDGEQVMLNQVRNRSDSDQPGCGGLESDQPLVKDNRSSTALVGAVLVASSHASAGASGERLCVS